MPTSRPSSSPEKEISSCLGYAVARVIAFLRRTGSDLPVEDVNFRDFLIYSILYLLQHESYRSNHKRDAFLSDFLFPLEIAADGRFQFALDHAPGQTFVPTIQVTSTSPGFHGLVLQRSETALTSCCAHDTVPTAFGRLQIGQIKKRVATSVDLERLYPELYEFKQHCGEMGLPIVYFLGAARQFPCRNGSHARAVAWQRATLETVFAVSEARYGDGIVFGTGGWAGRIEGSLGVPRLAYLAAVERGRKLLTTIPQCGTYDMHEESTLEAICGEHWGDDSPVLAAMCDGAFVLGAHGTWTQIEIQNLARQNKPFVVLNPPPDDDLERASAAVTSTPVSRPVFDDAGRAAQHLFDRIDGAQARCLDRGQVA